MSASSSLRAWSWRSIRGGEPARKGEGGVVLEHQWLTANTMETVGRLCSWRRGVGAETGREGPGRVGAERGRSFVELRAGARAAVGRRGAADGGEGSLGSKIRQPPGVKSLAPKLSLAVSREEEEVRKKKWPRGVKQGFGPG
jgi:hypothetical protein